MVEAGLPARLLDPDVEQLVDLVFVQDALLALDHVVVDAELAEEPLVVVVVHLFEVLEALPQRLFACGHRETVSQARRPGRGRLAGGGGGHLER